MRPIALYYLAMTALLLLGPAGCGETDPGYQHTYTTRGVIVTMPGEKAYEEFIVRHEPIPNYVSMNGSIGMEAMTMPFPLKDRSLVEGLAVGDKVEITYGETFEPDFDAGVISIKKLAADTELNLNATRSGAQTQSAAENELAPEWGAVRGEDHRSIARGVCPELLDPVMDWLGEVQTPASATDPAQADEPGL